MPRTAKQKCTARMRSPFILILATCITVWGPSFVLSHNDTVVHPGLTEFAFESQGTNLYDNFATELARQGSIDEDALARWLWHGYNPITGDGWGWGVANARDTAAARWAHAIQKYRSGELSGTDGAYHLLGRTLHLLQDMSSCAHVHTDIHGLDEEDFEPWGWDKDSETGHFPSYSLSSQTPKFPEDRSVSGFIDALARFTYDLSAFQGELIEVAGVQPDSELARMFPSLHYHDAGFIGDDYWEIDDVGRFKTWGFDDWWACEQDHTTDNSGPDGAYRIIGNFYVENAGGDSGTLTPHVFEKTGVYVSPNNSKSLLQIYGDILYPECVQYSAGLLEMFAEAVAPPLDLIFCIDTTGSMGDDIAAVKAAATTIIGQIAATVPSFRIAVVDYRDFPRSPYGGAGDYAYRDRLPFTNDVNSAVAAIQGLSLGWGADWQESVYSALMHAIESTSLGGWRGDPIKKAIILMGDAPPHDPEPYTGYTMAEVIQAAEDADPVIIYSIATGGGSTTHGYFAGLAEGTGGEFFSAANAGQVVAAIMEAIETITYSPFADAGGPYSGLVNQPVTIDASNSYDPDGLIVLYEWDWDSDGVWDMSALGPVVAHTWTTGFEGTVRMRVTDSDGLTSFDTAHVTIIENRPPVADAAGPYAVDEGGEVLLDGSASIDEDGDVLMFEWDLDNDGFCDDATGPQVVFSALNHDGPTTIYVTLCVSDPGGLMDSESTLVEVLNVAPSCAALPTAQTVQYSDRIETVYVRTEDVAADAMTVDTLWSANGGTSIPGLPDGMILTHVECDVEGNENICNWTLNGVADVRAGLYTILIRVTDDDGEAADVATEIAVLPERASVRFDDGNPVGVEVESPGDNSGMFSLLVEVKESQPDAPFGLGLPGDISNAVASMDLIPVGPGGTVTGNCSPLGVAGEGYDASLHVVCTFEDVPVNTYSAELTVDVAGYYTGVGEDVLVVFDPSLGFTTGGFWFYWPGTVDTSSGYPGDRTNVGYTMQYNRKGTAVRGSLLIVRHLPDDAIYRIKSNSIYGLAVGEDGTIDPYGWASFSGKATYKEPGLIDPLGNYEFVAYVEDRGNPGRGADRFWLNLRDRDGGTVLDMSFGSPAEANAVFIENGNIVVPHRRGGR